ncbi:MAG: hypothetical protein IJ566_01005 [Cardiobacteriaceae bacterium]|nr:hypothetical protein [Cardiobacteriaceae bacterium]
MQHYVYIDSRTLIGTFEMLIRYIHDGVFPADFVLLIKHRWYLTRFYKKLLNEQQIKYRIIYNAKDIESLTDGIVYYIVNHNSNLSLMANRKLKHVFVTHGESNKFTSVKPIIRAYDEVCVAGQAGIDRYLEIGLFSQYDVDTKRIKITADKYIGRTGLSKQGQEVIFYAPTWEGIIPQQENYSSLPFVEQVVENIVNCANKTNIRTVLIKPHPNTGLKNKKYFQYLEEITQRLKQENLTVLIYYFNLNRIYRITPAYYFNYTFLFFLHKHRIKNMATIVHDLSAYSAKIAFCDISAMETQILNENIPYYLFSAEKNKGVKFLDFVNTDNPYTQYYQNAKIVLGEKTTALKEINQDDFVKLKEYVVNNNERKSFFS